MACLLLQCGGLFSLDLHEESARFIRDTYETQRATRTIEELTECLGLEEVECLEAQVKERQKIVKMHELMRSGRVLEANSVMANIPMDNTKNQPAVSGMHSTAING